jgi:translation elongation factor EF-Tu-like GTPase
MSPSSSPSASPDDVFLFRVEDVFEITGRGSVPVPGIPHALTIPVKRGTPILLRTPDGTVVETSIRDVEMINSRRTRQGIAILVPHTIKKGGVPLGTEVWLSNPAG